MANARKRTSLLEKIRDGRAGGRDRMKLPEWWHDAPDGGPRFDEQPPEDGRRESSGWLWRPRRFQIAPGLLLVMLAVLGALLVTAYELGRRSAMADLARVQSADGAEDSGDATGSDQLRDQSINAALMRRDGGGNRDGNGSAGDADGRDGSTDRSGERDGQRESVHDQVGDTPAFFVSGSADDPRRVGYNYFCLVTMESRYKSEADRAVAFLRANDVDAAAVSVQNWTQVVVLRGFESPNSPQANQMASLLRGLGRIWKSEYRGGHDWSDLYPMKFTDGN